MIARKADIDLTIDWQVIELRGGPYAGQTMRVPRDQRDVVLHDDADQHRYLRIGCDHIFYHERLIHGAFNGGGGR